MTSIAENDKAIDYLAGDYLTNVSMIEPLKRGIAHVVRRHEGGVLVRMNEEDIYMAAADDRSELLSLIDMLDNPEMLVVHGMDLTEDIGQRFPHLTGMAPCVQAVYIKKELPVLKEKTDIRVLDQSYFLTIRAHYHTIDDEDYISYLVDSRVMRGIFMEGHLAGFIGMHAEGSIGLLEVFPEYKRRGLGTELQKYMIRDNLRKGYTPFGQVRQNNPESMCLQRKIGMEISEKTLWWYF